MNLRTTTKFWCLCDLNRLILLIQGLYKKKKMTINSSFVYLFAVLIFSSSCNKKNSTDTSESGQDSIWSATLPEEENIRYIVLKETTFNKELLANGKLKSIRKADLKFKSVGLIKEVLVHEGEHVNAGQLLALLDEQSARMSFNTAKLNYEQAILDYEDQLLRSGYKIKDTASISADTKSIARLRSGFSRAILNLRQ